MHMTAVLCLNGPNLDLLGSRQPEVYGADTLADLENRVQRWGKRMNMEVRCLQSNHEGELVEALHAASPLDGVVFNPGAFTHTSAALADAVAAIKAPVVEVHLSNVRSRQRWRRRSLVAPVAAATLYGRGQEGYRAALRHLANRQAYPFHTVRYGPHPDQILDLRAAQGPRGVVLVHGGFWMDNWGRDTVESWAVDLAGRGIPNANLEYRRTGSGGGPRASVNDIRRGIEAACDALGTGSVTVVGHSAGTHLALAAARSGTLPIDAVVSVSGVLELSPDSEYVAAFDPGLTTDPLAVEPPPFPVHLVHGKDDAEVPASHSEHFARHLETSGGAGTLEVMKGVGHFDALDPSGPAWKTVLAHLIP